MSLVGTRPILQDELQKYELHHRARIAIKPGITGMWQVSGRSDITDFEEVVRLDTESSTIQSIIYIILFVCVEPFLKIQNSYFLLLYGMTYHEDVAAVKDSFKKMLADGVYKAELFSDL